MSDDPVYGDHAEPPHEQVDRDTATTHEHHEATARQQPAPRNRALKTPRRNR